MWKKWINFIKLVNYQVSYFSSVMHLFHKVTASKCPVKLSNFRNNSLTPIQVALSMTLYTDANTEEKVKL